MRLLIDTHAFIWWTSDPDRLTQVALAACEEPGNEVLLSVASVWEMLIKEQLGKLRVASRVRTLVLDESQAGHIAILPIELDHLWVLESLPLHHRDPFDRMVFAQCRADGLTLVTVDPAAKRYGIDTLWWTVLSSDVGLTTTALDEMH